MLVVFSVLAPGRTLAADSPVKIAEKEGIGKYLTDQDGLALYYFTRDSGDKSACSGGCLERWPIFSAEITMAPEGVDAKDFKVITREDGQKQTAYKGRLLYYFVDDKKAGDTKGQGLFDVWFVVAP